MLSLSGCIKVSQDNKGDKGKTVPAKSLIPTIHKIFIPHNIVQFPAKSKTSTIFDGFATHDVVSTS